MKGNMLKPVGTNGECLCDLGVRIDLLNKISKAQSIRFNSFVYFIIKRFLVSKHPIVKAKDGYRLGENICNV